MSASNARQDGGELKRVESFQWPSGHVGHLTENQKDALARFKKLCEEKGYYVPGSDDGKTLPTHDDETLLRYLRARKFLPQDAFKQFSETEDWRKENQLDTLYETIDVQEYEQTRRLYPQWTGRRDRRGIPFYVYEVAQVDPKDVSAYNSNKDAKNSSPAPANTSGKTPRKMLRLFALYENLCRFVLPMCSALPDRPHGESPISQSSNVVDLSGVGFTKMWNLRNHMSDASQLATAHYPETLDRIFVVGAPSFFPTIWEWAKRWFDPITVSKIVILSKSNMRETLDKYVDLDNVPKKYGGNLDWQFGDMPFLEPHIAKNLRWKENIEEKGHRTLPIGPIRWEYDEDGDLVATAIGTENGKPRKRAIAGLRKEAGIACLALSPGRQDRQSQFSIVTGASQAKSQSTSNNGAPPDSVVANGQPVMPTQDPPTLNSEEPSKAAVMTENAKKSVCEGIDPAVPNNGRPDAFAITSQNHENDGSHPPSDSRQGTSNTRYEQQKFTHAHGKLKEGTPAIKVDSQGEKQALMEPRTVGQAPKEHPVPDPEDDQQPNVLDQAKEFAGKAYEQASQLSQTVMSAVGLGEKQDNKTSDTPVESKQHESEIDNMEGKHVEEFLREKTMSVAQPLEK